MSLKERERGCKVDGEIWLLWISSWQLINEVNINRVVNFVKAKTFFIWNNYNDKF
jgi:hypothetical protein